MGVKKLLTLATLLTSMYSAQAQNYLNITASNVINTKRATTDVSGEFQVATEIGGMIGLYASGDFARQKNNQGATLRQDFICGGIGIMTSDIVKGKDGVDAFGGGAFVLAKHNSSYNNLAFNRGLIIFAHADYPNGAIFDMRVGAHYNNLIEDNLDPRISKNYLTTERLYLQTKTKNGKSWSYLIKGTQLDVQNYAVVNNSKLNQNGTATLGIRQKPKGDNFRITSIEGRVSRQIYTEKFGNLSFEAGVTYAPTYAPYVAEVFGAPGQVSINFGIRTTLRTNIQKNPLIHSK